MNDDELMALIRSVDLSAARIPPGVRAIVDAVLASLRRDSPKETGVGEWCAPGPANIQKCQWLLVFDDADVGNMPFEDERAARECFAAHEAGGWNCYLFQLVPRVAAK